MAGFYAPNFDWLSLWGLGIGLFEPGGNLSLVVLSGLMVAMGISISAKPAVWVPWFDISRLFRVVVWLPFCPTPPILTIFFWGDSFLNSFTF